MSDALAIIGRISKDALWCSTSSLRSEESLLESVCKLQLQVRHRHLPTFQNHVEAPEGDSHGDFFISDDSYPTL